MPKLVNLNIFGTLYQTNLDIKVISWIAVFINTERVVIKYLGVPKIYKSK